MAALFVESDVDIDGAALLVLGFAFVVEGDFELSVLALGYGGQAGGVEHEDSVFRW
jgi:hypothetical protein